jgi:hypothetical protein
VESRTLIAKSFMDGLAKLTVDEQAAVKLAAFDLQHSPDHPSLRLHRVEAADPSMWSARVNRDIRIIISRRDGDAVLCYVGHHDDAYAWARRRRLEVHEVTGAAQFVVVDERVIETVKSITRLEVADELADPDHARPFRELEDATLLRYGVPRTWLDAVREATVDTFLSVIGDDLPAEAQENLLLIANGEVPPEPPLRPAADPFHHPDARRRFHFMPEADEAIRQALAAPWETWQLFLHPSQLDAVEQRHTGPARVSGGPGTGKTVVAVHRAVRLARSGKGAVLLTTFSKTLAARLVDQVRILTGIDDPGTMNLDIVHLHQRAVDLWKERMAATPRIASAKVVEAAVERAVRDVAPDGVDPAFVAAEWDMVIDPLGITSWDAYARVDRAARGNPLGRAARERLWPVLAMIREQLNADGFRTWSDVCWEVALMLEGDGEAPYRHVVADEVQDFGPAELQLLRALALEGSDDVFLAGDAHQRIYKPRSSFAGAGLEVRGRATVLRLNYRTTEQIRRVADQLISRSEETIAVDDARACSLLSGPEPEVRVVGGVRDEVDAVASWLRSLVSNGYRPEEIGVFARMRSIVEDRCRRAVAAAKLKAVALGNDEPVGSGVAVGTMHRSKGLQFRAVAVMAVEDGILPLARVLERSSDDAARRAFEERERNLLYVACTRSRERLLVTAVRRPSSFLPALQRK